MTKAIKNQITKPLLGVIWYIPHFYSQNDKSNKEYNKVASVLVGLFKTIEVQLK